MNAKKVKLIRQYAKRFSEEYKILKKQFKSVPKEGQEKLLVHMRRYIHT